VVLQANLDFSYEIRPAYWVLPAGLALMVAKLAGRRNGAPRRALASRVVASAAGK